MSSNWDMLKKRKRIVDFLINLIVISNMIFGVAVLDYQR